MASRIRCSGAEFDKKEILGLVRKGADMHLIVCAYWTGDQLVHRILGSEPEDDFLEGPYLDYFQAIAVTPEHVAHVFTPLFDAAKALDQQAISSYAALGAQFSAITRRIVQHGLPVHKLLNPFQCASESGRGDIVGQLMRLTVPGDALAHRWLAEALPSATSSYMYTLLLMHGADLAYSRFPKARVNEVANLLVSFSGSAVVPIQHKSGQVTIMYLDATHELCGDCSQALITGLIVAKSSRNSYGSPCRLCLLLDDCGHFIIHAPRTLAYTSNPLDGELVLTFGDQKIRHPLRTIPGKCSSDFRPNQLSPISNAGCGVSLHETLKRIRLLPDDATSSLAAIELATYWLRTCVKDHVQCNHGPNQAYFPTRVLDISGMGVGRHPRLVQNVSLPGAYVALSHRWGSTGLPITTVANLEERQNEIDSSELSQVMLDAISITQGLGFCYIWIDALCIIQDSPEDWLAEASKMSSVFNNAVITIAAADAEDHSQGMFRKRTARCIRPFQMPYFEHPSVKPEDIQYVFPKNRLLGGRSRMKGTLDTRGWILQEQLLSRRILYYDEGEVHWDCITSSASESSPVSISLLDETNPEEAWALKLLRRTLAGSLSNHELRKRICDAWLEVIKNYSARVLTKPDDRLIALVGIIEPLKGILNEEPIAGMWRNQLWQQLIWWTDTTTPPLRENSGFTAPSWSWLSVQERVYYHNSLPGDRPPQDALQHKFTDLESYCFNIDSAEAWPLPDKVGLMGRLVVTAQFFSYYLTASDLITPVRKRWEKAKLKLNTGRWMFDRPVEVPLDVHCLIVAEDNVAKILVCLVILPEGVGGDTWRRIGLCHWDGLAWQIPSFVGVTPETRTFALV